MTEDNDALGRRLLAAFRGRTSGGQQLCIYCKAAGGFELEHKPDCVIYAAGNQLMCAPDYSTIAALRKRVSELETGSSGNKFYGWFDDAEQTEPSYDPPHNAPCPFCGVSISGDDVQTPSLLYVGQYAARSYFYRQHKSCAKRFYPLNMDGFILDMIERNGD